MKLTNREKYLLTKLIDTRLEELRNETIPWKGVAISKSIKTQITEHETLKTRKLNESIKEER